MPDHRYKNRDELRMENEILRKILFPCKTCHGLGKLDDAEPGDISFREWPCPDCSGFNAAAAKKELEDAYHG